MQSLPKILHWTNRQIFYRQIPRTHPEKHHPAKINKHRALNQPQPQLFEHLLKTRNHRNLT